MASSWNPVSVSSSILPISYLGNIITKDGIETDPKKIATIKQWPQPTTVTDVHSSVFWALQTIIGDSFQWYMQMTKILTV